MKRCIVLFVCLLALLTNTAHAAGYPGYSTYTYIYKRNDVTVQFTQVRNMADQKKQNEINYILESINFYRAKGTILVEMPDHYVDALGTINSASGAHVFIDSEVKFKNSRILSVFNESMSTGSGWSSFSVFCRNVDMATGEVIPLGDVLDINNAFWDYVERGGDEVAAIREIAWSSAPAQREQQLRENVDNWYITEDGAITISAYHNRSYSSSKIPEKYVNPITSFVKG